MDAPYKVGFWHHLPRPGRRAAGRAFLVEAGTVAALLATLLAITFGLRSWGAAAWLVILPLPVLAGALRRPRHGWLLALEFALSIWLSALADVAWRPPAAGASEPLLDVLVNVPIFILLAWPLVALGLALGAAAVGRHRRPPAARLPGRGRRDSSPRAAVAGGNAAPPVLAPVVNRTPTAQGFDCPMLRDALRAEGAIRADAPLAREDR